MFLDCTNATLENFYPCFTSKIRYWSNASRVKRRDSFSRHWRKFRSFRSTPWRSWRNTRSRNVSEDTYRETGNQNSRDSCAAEAGGRSRSSWPLLCQRRERVADEVTSWRSGDRVSQSHLSIIIIDEHVGRDAAADCSVCAAIAADGGCARYPRKHEATRYQRPVDTAAGVLTERRRDKEKRGAKRARERDRAGMSEAKKRGETATMRKNEGRGIGRKMKKCLAIRPWWLVDNFSRPRRFETPRNQPNRGNFVGKWSFVLRGLPLRLGSSPTVSFVRTSLNYWRCDARLSMARVRLRDVGARYRAKAEALGSKKTGWKSENCADVVGNAVELLGGTGRSGTANR